MNEKKIKDFWQDHSLEFLEMALKRDYQERLHHPDGYGKRTGDCGDTIEFFLKENRGVLTTIAYDINGCVNTNACANTVINMALGKTVEEAWTISPDDVETYLKTLPAHEKHCAELAVGAFYLALRDLAQHGAMKGYKT